MSAKSAAPVAGGSEPGYEDPAIVGSRLFAERSALRRRPAIRANRGSAARLGWNTLGERERDLSRAGARVGPDLVGEGTPDAPRGSSRGGCKLGQLGALWPGTAGGVGLELRGSRCRVGQHAVQLRPGLLATSIGEPLQLAEVP
jgi:hypothetical protein